MPVCDFTFVNPLKKVQQLFESNPQLTHNDVQQVYQEYLTDPNSLKKIHSVNKKSFPHLNNGSLVHVRCMVQDMLNPEFYVPTYHVTHNNTTMCHSSMYTDQINVGSNVRWGEGYAERNIYYCTPVPGETSWFQLLEDGKFCQESPSTMLSHEVVKRRRVDDGNDGEVVQDVPMQEAGSSVDQGTTDHTVQHEVCAVVLKVYDTEKQVKLNEVLDVVGVLSLQTHFNNSDEEDWDHYHDHVPKVHVITFIKPYQIPQHVTELPSRAEACRHQLLTLMTSQLQGDSCAAETLLYHMISSVYARHDVRAIGKLSVNIHSITQDHLPTSLSLLMSSLLTKSTVFEMSLDNMNKNRLVPVKDYKQNKLQTGLLQLSNGTQLIIDETKLTPGKLESVGLINMAALRDLIEWQKVGYDFQYHTTDFDTDIRVLILSETKSLLKADLVVKLAPTTQSDPANTTEQDYNTLRDYLNYISNITFTIPDNVLKLVEGDFVKERQENNMSVEQMHSLLTISRYVAMSEGNHELHEKHWSHAKQLLLQIINRK